MESQSRAAVQWAIGVLVKSAPHDIAPSLRLKEDLGIDSLEFVELVQLIEQRLEIRISDEAVASVRDVGALLRAVEDSCGGPKTAVP